jgi:arabinoxylan arabinofuranohydrolase
MTSKDPLKWDSTNFAGMVFANTGSQRIDNGGNNHHSIIYFKGKYYVAYHSRQQALRMGITAIDSGNPNDRSKDSSDGNYRSTQLNECSFNNGKLSCSGDMVGIKTQLENLNPYETVGAETMSNQSKGITVQGTGDTQVVAKANEWTKVSGVEFQGTKLVRVKASSKNGAVIRMTTGKVNGDVLAYIEVPAGGSMEEIEAGVSQNLSGVEDVYFSFSGDVTFDSWVVE